ncbi:TerB family tellurite resistance protein [Psychromonas aquatilis]|uniref:TerB family tellurite resistance protein n=1 Tax=Psychromonas aquatilis TaxID=2005072 RepID=A0ABU9GMV3_9GAMM
MMISNIKHFLNKFIADDSPTFDSTFATVCLLCQVGLADQKCTPEEESAIVRSLSKLVNIDKANANELLKIGMNAAKESNSVFDFTSQLVELDAQSRTALIEAMWRVAYADGYLDEMEEALIRKVANLIYVNHSDFIRTKLLVQPA